jgi:LysR family transcriptional regulator, glycine cleavage system transcriptional activator
MGAIRAFAAAARLLSFTRAADELGVTQSAVSHGIRELEARIGKPLFVRDGRRLALTEVGRLYLPFVGDALDRLKAGDRALADPERNPHVLTVSVSPSFAAKWLVPRLGAFFGEHPDLDLRISATPQHVNLSDGEIDLAVRHGDGHWPALHSVQLCRERLFPVCNPVLLAEGETLGAADLGERPLIHHRSPEAWIDWFRTIGVEPPAGVKHGPVYNEMSLAIDAAVAGQGVALARSALAALDLDAGRLVRPVTEDAPASFGYWIVCDRASADLPKIARFRAWLLREAGGA